ncbi:hypothetical protein [Kistimonas asteriae]|uniref:hypothetical protein n=1 Tax=Kistimonas asteriae TaxID=517724 RepID=UPI001BA71E2D|nr:hypothetical protein [Kistimonas asteriae]
MTDDEAYTLWVTLEKAARLTGYSTNALRLKIYNDVLTENYHWIRGKDGRLLMNIDTFCEWIEYG